MWRQLKTDTFIDLEETLFSGQAFHFERVGSVLYIGNVRGCPAVMAQHGEKVYFFELCDGLEGALRAFFNLDVDLPPEFEKTGLRFITNDVHSAIFSFICSANNNIKRISRMVKFIYSLGSPFNLAEMYSEYLQAHPMLNEADQPTLPDVRELLAELRIFRFPDLDIIGQSRELFREQKFGYRADFLADAARFLSQFEGSWGDLTFEEARRTLMSIKGVGRKVADCVCLMSLRFFHVVPLDTHLIRHSAAEFKLRYETMNDRVYSEIQRLWVEQYGMFAGVKQLYVFKRSVDARAKR